MGIRIILHLGPFKLDTLVSHRTAHSFKGYTAKSIAIAIESELAICFPLFHKCVG
jgi:hypothetical protein